MTTSSTAQVKQLHDDIVIWQNATVEQKQPGIGLGSAARFSHCGDYRYALSRDWDTSLPTLIVIGLNPSTADAFVDDPTIRRCIGFAKRDGFGGLFMLNLFALRSTDPKVMLAHADPVGLYNDLTIRLLTGHNTTVLAAWGTHGRHLDRDRQVMQLLDGAREVVCLGTNANGTPKHPLYIKADTPFIPYSMDPAS